MRPMARAFPLLPISICCTVAIAMAVEMTPAVTAPPKTSKPDAPLNVSNDVAMEQGKALYDKRQYRLALAQFMTVLRRDPHHSEARRQIRMVVEAMRKNPADFSETPAGQAFGPSNLVQKRSLLTTNLKAIPGVAVRPQGGSAFVIIDTPSLFDPKGGGLKDDGIPLLDRVSDWLKTFGDEFVIIHCYPEELQNPGVNGSLFLHRYAALYRYFVDERKLSPQRFVSADLLSQMEEKGKGSPQSIFAPSKDQGLASISTPPHVVIETFGGQAGLADDVASPDARRKLSRWIEFSLELPEYAFNPEEGEWATIDAAALSRNGIRNWSVAITPRGSRREEVFSVEGKGNVLRRLTWDGRNQKTRDFVPGGHYSCRLMATDADGIVKAREKTLRVVRAAGGQSARNRASKNEEAKSESMAATTAATSEPAPASSESSPSVSRANVDVSSALAPAVATTEPTSEAGSAAAQPAPAPAGEQANDTNAESPGGAQAIWKQVIRFEPNQSDLQPAIKGSLERIGKTLEVYPLQKVRIVGFAMASEQDALALAQRRAETVRSVLVHQYHMDSKRVIVAGGRVVPTRDGACRVEMSITN